MSPPPPGTAVHAQESPDAHGGRARAGSPPAVGTIGEDAIDRILDQWVRRPKLPADHVRLPHKLLLSQLAALRTGREDLSVFAAAGTPIHERTFDYLDALLHLGNQLKVKDRKVPASVPRTAAARQAYESAVTCLRAVLQRAEACGRPLRLFELTRTPWGPDGVVAQLFHVVQAGRRRAEKWDDPVRVTILFSELEQSALALERAWKLPGTVVGSHPDELRTVGLHRLLFDAAVYLGAYGRSVLDPEDPRRKPYLLPLLFPNKRAAYALPPLTKLLA